MPRKAILLLTLIMLTLVTACATTTTTARAREDMVYIPAGEFMMGSPPGEGRDDQHPRHLVCVDAFYMDRYEVTVGEYKRFLEETGHRELPEWVHEFAPGDEYPVVGVNWDDAIEYAKWAKKRLPTEAEWEYACRAGTTTKYNVGDIISRDDANFAGVGGRDQWERTAPVGSFEPNAWGLYDMHGNVFEWCQDRYDEDYYNRSPKDNPQGPPEIRYYHRVIRGGAWVSTGFFRGSASRLAGLPDKEGHNVGFRCVRNAR